jgi:hypothetical protein
MGQVLVSATTNSDWFLGITHLTSPPLPREHVSKN